MLKKKHWIFLDIFLASIIIFFVSLFLMKILSSSLKTFPINFIYIFSTLISFILGNLYLYVKYPISISHLGFESNNIKNTIVWAIKGGIVLILLNFPYKIFFAEQKIPIEHLIESQQGIEFVLFFLIIAVIFIPIVEELFYRAFLFRLIKNRFGLVAGYLVSTGFFALGHMFSKMSIINSLIFCYIYDKSGRIGPCIIVHTILNFVWYTAIYGIQGAPNNMGVTY